MTDFEIFIGGSFKRTSNEIYVENPYSGEKFARTWLADKNDLELAITKAKLVEQELKTMPSHNKYQILMQIAEGLISRANEFAEILSKESGKPGKYAVGEVNRAIQTFIVAAEESKRLPGEYMSIDWTNAGEGKEGIVKYFPVGLVAGISPFNFPLNLAVHKIAPAIATGCPIVLKPATSTPLSTLLLAKVINSTDLPNGAISILPMDRNTGNLLVTDERFKLLTFTGSPEVGWEMKQKAGKKKIVLELGGNAGVVVTKTADLDLAVKKCVVGGFAYSGQVCIHAQRIYVEDVIFDQFTEQFVSQVKQLKTGDPLNTDTDISVMIDENNSKRVEAWVEEAFENGAEVLCGGKRNGTFYEPTVLSNTKSDMKVCSLEVFGPVVTLEKYSAFDEVIKEVNNSRYGLQAGVFTNEISQMNFAFQNLEVGGVIINDIPTFRVDHMPYGGIKDSGLGREGVKYAMHDMLEPKLLVKNL